MFSPMDFIPAMEYNETVHMIDLYVFRHVCEYISGWIEAGKNIKPVSVNISHCTIVRPNFMEILWIFGLIIISRKIRL